MSPSEESFFTPTKSAHASSAATAAASGQVETPKSTKRDASHFDELKSVKKALLKTELELQTVQVSTQRTAMDQMRSARKVESQLREAETKISRLEKEKLKLSEREDTEREKRQSVETEAQAAAVRSNHSTLTQMVADAKLPP